MATEQPNRRVREKIPVPNLKNNKVRRREARWAKDMDRRMALERLRMRYTSE